MAADDQRHLLAMQHALSLAEKSPPKPSNFRVGAIVIDIATNEIVAQGYTLECTGNTHAEQCCFIKLAEKYNTSEVNLASVMTKPHALYTTMEPCFKRLSGNLPCVERILQQKSWITEVYVGVLEPETFVGPNPGRKLLQDHNIKVTLVPGLQDKILQVATAGHNPS